jgi:hypothetical protein
MSIYFGLAISSTMFPKECVIVRKEIDSKSPNNILKSLINASIIICDPFHKRIINILESRFSLNIDIKFIQVLYMKLKKPQLKKMNILLN